MFQSSKSWMLLAFVLQIGSVQAQDIQKWKVKGNKVTCMSREEGCYQVKKGCFKKWETFEGQIDGYEPGGSKTQKITIETLPQSQDVKLAGSGKHTTKGVAPAVFEGVWLIRSVQGTAINNPKVRLQFDLAKNRAWGNGGCNGFNTEVQVTNYTTVTFGEVVSTMMACDKLQEEHLLLTALNKGVYDVVQEDFTIWLVTKEGKKVIQCQLQNIELEATLQKGFWQLITLDGVSKNYGKVGLRFDKEAQKIHAFGGCNTIAVDFQVQGNQLITKEYITTLIGCTDDIMKVERALLQHLKNNEITVDIIEHIMYFRKEGRTLAVFNLVDQ